MRNGLEAYKTWAPDGMMWTEWAKPVLFASGIRAPYELSNYVLTIPEIQFPLDFQTMLILDLPGNRGVEEALAFARCGYRPVPLYNSVDGPSNKSIVYTRDILHALLFGADVLDNLILRPDLPPAFMLDANRMRFGGKQPGSYDNRWCVFPQDMPSAAFLQRQKIHKVVVRSDAIKADLSAVIHRYQKSGTEIVFWDTKNNEMRTIILNNAWIEQGISRFSVIAGLTRNTIGGFGGMVPEPYNENGYYGYHGFG